MTMYYEHFGLEKNPFSLTPDPQFLFFTEKHREALAGLALTVGYRKGFCVLTGEAGTGKTTLIGQLLRTMPAHKARFSVMVNPTLSPSEFLEAVLLEFGFTEIPASKSLRLARLRAFLLEGHDKGVASALVVDEAHKLSHELLEDVRLLSNLELAEHKLLQILLVGQPELDTMLAEDTLRQLRQRIAIRLRLSPMDGAEARRYLESRWTRAGATAALPFSDRALELAIQWSGGIPRVMNTICDVALLSAYAGGAKRVEAKDVLEAIGDLQLAVASPGGAVHPATLPRPRPPASPADTQPGRPAATPEPDPPAPDRQSGGPGRMRERFRESLSRWPQWLAARGEVRQ